MNSTLKALISLLFLFVMMAFAYLQSEAPARQAGSDLNYATLSQHVASMTTRPHPIGSPANREVRDYIVTQFESMGLATEVQRATVVDSYWSARAGANSMVANVENIIARLPGSGVPDAQEPSDLVLMAHYDSRENALGAGDDISGTASILEVARIMSEGPQPVRDVVFLITDGEEIGLMGAQGFFMQHPAAKQAGLVLNFEARGSSGNPSLFETSSNNAWLVEQISRAIPDLVGDSLTYEVYRRMPNDTDMSISKAEDIPGLNFAFAKSLIDYHAMTDSADNLDENSLARMAHYALAATRHFANLEEWQSSQTDRTFFNTGVGSVVSYTQTTASILGFVTLILAIAILVAALRRHWVSWRMLAMGSVAMLTVLIFTFAVFQVAMKFATAWRAGAYPENAGMFYVVSLGEWPFLAYVLLTLGGLLWFDQAIKRGLTRRDVFVPAMLLAIAALLSGSWILALVLILIAVPCMMLLQRTKTKPDLWLASLVLWWLLALLVVVTAPNASYVFILPLLSVLLAVAIQMKTQFPINSVGRFVLVVLGGFIPLLLLAPLLLSIYVLTGSTAPQGAMVLCTLCLLLIWPLSRQIGALIDAKTGPLFIGLGLVWVVMLFSIRSYDARHPLGEELFYAVDADTGENFWVSGDARPGTWLAEFIGEESGEFDYSQLIPGYFESAVSKPAQALPIRPATLEVLSDSGQDQREISMLFRSPSEADYINLLLPADAGIQSLTANGQAIKVPDEYSDSGWWRIRWYGLPKEGATINMSMDKNGSLSAKLVEVKHQMPKGAPVRPAHSMPRPYTWSDSTVIFQTLTFD